MLQTFVSQIATWALKITVRMNPQAYIKMNDWGAGLLTGEHFVHAQKTKSKAAVTRQFLHSG